PDKSEECFAQKSASFSMKSNTIRERPGYLGESMTKYSQHTRQTRNTQTVNGTQRQI
ncbi:unnamed protein product, partial [Ceratitis capitata]